MEEDSQQELALTQVRSFVLALKKIVIIQSWWRMHNYKKVFKEYKNDRRKRKSRFFIAWKKYYSACKKYFIILAGKPFHAWLNEIKLQQKLNAVVKNYFQNCVERLNLTPQAVMAYFNREKWNIHLSGINESKIRRLILQKLIAGWRANVRFLKG
jgi:hypothetical protein